MKKFTKQMIREAVDRLNYLTVYPDAVTDFATNGKVWVSDTGNSRYELMLTPADDDMQKQIDDYQETTGNLVYHVIHGNYTVAGTPMTMDSFLIVSPYKNEWKLEHNDMKYGVVAGYVINQTFPEFSEHGVVCVEPVFNGLVRNNNGYDYKSFNKNREGVNAW